MKVTSDISLVARVVVFGDKRAFDALVRKYQSDVRAFFMGMTLGDAPLSDDLAQETFIKVYTRITTFRGKSGFKTWLFRIAYNVYADYVRSRKHVCDIDDSVRRCGTGGTDGGLRIDIYESLALLKADERMCVTLQLIDGQSVGRIAEITGMAEGTVKSHLSRGKAKLAAFLKENGYG